MRQTKKISMPEDGELIYRQQDDAKSPVKLEHRIFRICGCAVPDEVAFMSSGVV
jgi:hypothetical protein